MNFESWIVGFVDGEGCFSIAINQHSEMTMGYQVQAEFAITQSISSADVMYEIRDHFNCGTIQLNLRTDNHHEDLMIYRVRKVGDLVRTIIPFFVNHPLKTAKQKQFLLFCEAVEIMAQRGHLESTGFQSICNSANRMNQRVKRQHFMESPETIRQAPHSK